MGKTDMSIKNTPKRIPFSGGINTVAERAVINGFSAKNNFRDKLPHSFEARKGQVRHHTTTDLEQEVTKLFQLVDRAGVKSFYAQRVDGSVHKSTDNPPSTTTGNFGSQVLGAVSNAIPASTSIMDNYLFYSDGVRQHQVYAGTGQRVTGFIVYKGSAAIPVIPQIGEDYTDEIQDTITTRVAVLNSLNTLANFNAIYIHTEVPANSFTFTMQNVNINAATTLVQYWNGAWTSVSGFSDGTSLAGATLGQSGIMSFTHPTDELDYFQFGKSGFWYRLSVSAILDTTVSISQAVYSSNWQALRNVWSGELDLVAEAQVYRINQLKQETWAGSSIPLGGLFATSGEWVYFVSLEKLWGFYANMGGTPNIVQATITGSSDISFVDGGTSDDYITWQQARFLEEGFEEGQSIVITGTASNNKTVKIKSVQSNKIYVETGLLTAETNVSATLTFTNTGATLDVEVWTGAGYENVSSLTDGTASFSKSGYVTFSRTTTAQKSMQNGSFIYGYWYRFNLNKVISRNCIMAIGTMPFYDIADWGLGYCNESWGAESRRPVIAFDKDPVVIIGETHRPMVFNGSGFYPTTVGDGRSNKVLAMVNLYADLLTFQEEIGEKGGCITMIQGFDPKTFGKMTISNKEGIVNPKAYCVIHSFETPNNPKAATSPVVFFISRYGIYFCDGAGLTNVSYNIANYFDSTDTANCIRKGYENKHWMTYDSSSNTIMVGLCTGSSATVANTFFVFNPKTRAWGTDTRGQALTCIAEIEAASGNVSTLQIGGSSDGFVYRLNNGINDVGATTVAVSGFATLEIDGGGAKIDCKTVQVRCKAQSAGSITMSVAYDGNTSYVDSYTLSMVAKNVGETYVYNDIQINRGLYDHLSLKFEHNTVGESCTLLDVTLLDVEGKNVFKS